MVAVSGVGQAVTGENAILADVADAFHSKCWSWRRRLRPGYGLDDTVCLGTG